MHVPNAQHCGAMGHTDISELYYHIHVSFYGSLRHHLRTSQSLLQAYCVVLIFSWYQRPVAAGMHIV